MKHKILTILVILLVGSVSVFSQGGQRTINGTVKAPDGEPLIGVTIIVKDQPGLGTITNADGEYTIRAGEYDILLIKYIGHKSVELPVVRGEFNVVLEEEDTALKEVVVSAAGVIQPKATLTGAISTVDVSKLNVPSANLSNALIGNIVGIIGYQSTGEPGENTTEFWVRGISTFGANSKALVLVDGIERSLEQLNVEDIESFSVLKDASATAIYGSRGANGVILISTKRGTAGKVNINVKTEYGYNTRSRTPSYTDGITYATMANEARMTRYQDPIYMAQDIESIRRGLAPDLLPDINWQDVILRQGASNYRTTLSLSGGGATARYYVSGSYFNEEGIYKTNNINKYSTNVAYGRYNYRSNVDVDITKTTLLRVGVGGFLINQTKPRISSDQIWESLSNLTPLTVPRMYSNGLIPTYGTGGEMNPEVQLNRTGYQTIWQNKVETNLALEQNLEFITEGLRFVGTFSFDTENSNVIVRQKQPELWRASNNYDPITGKLIMSRIAMEELMSQSGTADGRRRYYTEAKLDYNRMFGNHRITSLLMYYQQEKVNTVKVTENDPRSSIPFRNIGVSGRATYGYKDKYLLDLNFGFNGSENFEPAKRFGFFPAISGAWVISEENFVKRNLKWLNMFKIRYSYGQVGNDKISNDENDYRSRFPYMSFIERSDGFTYGEYNSNHVPGYRVTTFGTPNLTWEVAEKHNLGTDIVFWNNKISLTSDIFYDYRKDIFMKRGQMPFTTGLQDIQAYANIGEMESKGIEGIASYTDKIGEVSFTLRGNFTFATTNVINYDEADNALYYQMTKGYRLNQTRGLIALGLFKDQQDIETSPLQTFGTYLPGDIKYKDVNGDGLINNKDVVPIGNTHIPNFVYGAGLNMRWKGWDMNVLLQGSGMSDFFINGNSIYLFQGKEVGNILEYMTNPNDRWISREISGSESTENPNAFIPRLSYGNNPNNFQNSTFWLRDGRYLRLKNLEFGYNFPKRIANSIYAENIRLGFIGQNLLVFSPFKWWDPEIGSSNGAKYPISKTFSFNFMINF